MSQLPHHHHDSIRLQALAEKHSDLSPFQSASDVFAQLSSPTRLRLFWLLCHGEDCVVNLAALMGMTSPAISHHLRALRSQGLLESRREGKEVYYRLSATEKARALHRMIEEMIEITCPL